MRTRIRIKEVIRNGNEIYLELGAGRKRGEDGWITLDMNNECDLYWDLRHGIPFPDLSVSKIYSSHFFEHLTYNEGQILFKECKRVLRLGGIFSICVPNAKTYIDAYVNDNSNSIEEYFQYRPAYNNTTKIDYVNYIAYMGGVHKYMYDQEILLHILNKLGFINVHIRSYDPTIDLLVRDYESIYAEAEK